MHHKSETKQKREGKSNMTTENVIVPMIPTDKVESLLKVLIGLNKLSQEQQITLLLNQMNQMEKNYNSVLHELSSVKEQLAQMNAPQEKRSAIIAAVVDFEGNVKSKYHELQDMGKNLNDKSAEMIQKFKENGVKALNNVCKFLGIKEALIKLKDHMQTNAVEMQGSIDKINKVADEFKNAVVHTQNVGKAIAGKETIDPATKEQSKFFERLKSPYLKMKNFYVSMSKKLSKAIEKFENLEQKASRSSVKEKLEDNIAKASAADSREIPQQEKHYEQAAR